MRSGAVLLAFGAGGGLIPMVGLGFGNRFESPEHSSVSQKFKNLRGAEHQVPETPSLGKR
jgi:hypothetical protein